MAAIVLGKPHEAYGAPGRYIKDNDQYTSIFGENKHDLNLFLTAIKIQRKIDNALLSQKLGIERGGQAKDTLLRLDVCRARLTEESAS